MLSFIILLNLESVRHLYVIRLDAVDCVKTFFGSMQDKRPAHTEQSFQRFIADYALAYCRNFLPHVAWYVKSTNCSKQMLSVPITVDSPLLLEPGIADWIVVILVGKLLSHEFFDLLGQGGPTTHNPLVDHWVHSEQGLSQKQSIR